MQAAQPCDVSSHSGASPAVTLSADYRRNQLGILPGDDTTDVPGGSMGRPDVGRELYPPVPDDFWGEASLMKELIRVER